MKIRKLIAPLFAVLLVPAAASAAPTVVFGAEDALKLDNQSFDVLSPPSVSVTADGADWVRAEVWQADTPNGDHGAVHLYLARSGSSWSGTLPVNHAGATFVRFRAGDDSTGETAVTQTYRYVATENFESADALGPVRRPVWGAQGAWYRAWAGSTDKSGTVAGWTATSVRMPSATSIILNGSSAPVASRHSQISTENSIAAGTIWFKARGNTREFDAELIVERIVGTKRTTLQTVKIPAKTDDNDASWTQYQIVLQDSTEGRIGFRNAAYSTSGSVRDASAVLITDIIITSPQPDVKIYRHDADYEPGFPSVMDPIVFRCAVSNVFAAADAQCLTPKLVWRQNGGDWNVTEMTNVLGRTVQTDGEYAVSLTEHTAGSFEYFFRADFAGYTPTFEAVHSRTVSDVDHVRYFTPGDFVSFNANPESGGNVVSRIEPTFEEVEFDPDSLSALSRSPAYSYDLFDWQTETGSSAANLGDFVYRNENDSEYPVVTEWEMSHRFDVENLYGGWLRTLSACAETVTIEDVYPYSKPLADDGIRRFRSKYKTLALAVADHPSAEAPSFLDESYPMQQVGDFTWQAIIRLTNAVDAAMSVTGGWEYAESERMFDVGPFEWGEVAQDETAINPPMSGALTRVGPREQEPGDWAPVRTQIDYKGFLMFRFCTTNGAYQIRRAAWQDFNAWQSDDEWFSRSFGLYNTKTFETDVDTATVTVDGSVDVDPDEWATSVSTRMLQSAYKGGVVANNAWFVKERVRKVKTDYSSTDQNMAWKLSTSELSPGSLQTTSVIGGAGRGTLSMRVRATTDDDRGVVYTGLAAASTWQNKRFVARFTKAKLSDGMPSVSVYGYWRDPDNYWEARVTQTNTLSSGSSVSDSEKPGLVLEMFVKENGTLSRLGAKTWSDANAVLDRSGDYLLDLDLATVSEGSVKARCYLLRSNGSFANDNKTTEPGRPNNALAIENVTRSTAVDSGSFGMNIRDCEAELAPYVYEWHGGTTSTSSTTDESVVSSGSATLANKTVTLSSAGDWTTPVHDGKTVYQGASPWTVTGGSGSDPTAVQTTMKREDHKASYRIKVFRSGEEEASDWVAPVPTESEDWDDHWDAIHGHEFDSVFSVSSFGWNEVDIPMSLWDDTYVMVEALPADASGTPSTAALLVDDLSITEWRGRTIWHEDYGSDQINRYESWKGSYAIVSQESQGATTNRVFVLDRTRANPEKEQSVTTPELENGVGDLYFSYRAEGAPVHFVVERIFGDDDPRVEPYFSVTASVSSVWIPKYVPVLDSEGGRIRIRTERLYDANDEEVFGRLLIDNLRATDYPNDEESSWEAYNVLVSTFRSSEAIHSQLSQNDALALKFDGPANPEDYRSAVLNDWTDHDTVQGNTFADSKSYVQTPSIATGIGEVSFWYRRSPDTAESAKLRLLVATAASPVESDWKELTAEDLNPDSDTYAEQVAALEGLSSIDNSEWRYFTTEFYQADYKVLRLVGETNGVNRVMLDNVLVTEPVRSSIDVGTIEFDPGIPLVTGDVGATIRLVNPRMRPTDIEVALDYYVGTNRWGYAAWKDRKTGSIAFTNAVTELADGSFRTEPYVFVSSERIPHFRVDDVVQYCAVVTYKGTFPSPVYSETQGRTDNGFWFENPPWYEPTDLNKAFGTVEQPVAHYWVFSCTTNVVWINELKYMTLNDGDSAQANQFVEIIGPEGASLAGWTLEHYGNEAGALSPNYVMWTNTMVPAATFQPPNNGTEGNPKGWGFWTLGCSGLYPGAANQELFPYEETSKSLNVDHVYMDFVGALRLRRSMGAYVDKIAWGNNTSSIRDFLDDGFDAAGYSRTAGAVAGLRGENDELSWATFSSSYRTVGGYNQDEELVLGYVDSVDEGGGDEPEVPLPANPTITSFAFADGATIEIAFSVSVTNGVALEAGSGWTWQVWEASDLDGEDSWALQRRATFVGDVTAPADGTATTHVVTVPYSDDASARFYRIRAVRED